MGAVLVTGGAGYIGSHAVRALRDAGLAVVVLDSLVAGHPEAVEGVTLVQAEVADTAVVRETIQRHEVTAVMHFRRLSLGGRVGQRAGPLLRQQRGADA